ncbi:MAG: L-aspartate oxidase [Alphaproteobacteria bacterium]|nr:L-aspartate oxidase [Alphaproteobacteria bacterium]
MVDTKTNNSTSFLNHKSENKKTTALVIGSGVAGLMSALKLSEVVDEVVITSLSLSVGASSTYAQGGIAVAVGNDDHVKHHAEDTIKVACGIGDEEIIHMVTSKGPALLQELVQLGVDFDRCEEKHEIKFGREAAHSRRRIAHAGGDQTGKMIMLALENTVRNTANIIIYENASSKELIIDDKGCVLGAKVRLSDGKKITCKADATVLSTGGLGQLYTYTTNPVGVNGEGMVMAAMIGATMSDMEFVQFHPTAFAFEQNPVPLATEAIRGDGAYLVTEDGERFMPAIHKDAELAPRDIVSRAIWDNISIGHKVFLDARHSTGENFPDRFPTVYQYCIDNGINPITDLIPVSPVAHYQMGGVKVNHKGRTSVCRLWACGEISATGLHGANRLASNSLLEALVYADNVAKDVKSTIQNDELWNNKIDGLGKIDSLKTSYPGIKDENSDDDLKIIRSLQDHMYDYAGVTRNAEGLKKLISFIDKTIEEKLNYVISRELLCRLILSKMVAKSALKRTESRGSHYRSDYPDTLDEFAYNSEINIFDVLGGNY